MPIPGNLQNLPAADLIGIAVVDPGTFIGRDHTPGRGVEKVREWRTRAVWHVLEQCGVNPHRTFTSPTARRAFDDAETATLPHCPTCRSTLRSVREMTGCGFRCDDPSRWHATTPDPDTAPTDNDGSN
ncbi:hypothetical protein [Actinoplanes sp. URMC 104]|uniref:hypothetical protein n=1 Tax=Actinoplanes sp. URMC 104 TaxID=3423409 RepID=UPI003F1CB997